MRSLVKLIPTPSIESSSDGWVTTTRDRHVATAAAFGFVTAKDRGDDLQRLLVGVSHLAATSRELSMQPLAQTVERADRERSQGLEPTFTNGLSPFAPGQEIVLPFRIGYPTADAAPSPRRPAEQVLRS
jgi:hypothetical protein